MGGMLVVLDMKRPVPPQKPLSIHLDGPDQVMCASDESHQAVLLQWCVSTYLLSS